MPRDGTPSKGMPHDGTDLKLLEHLDDFDLLCIFDWLKLSDLMNVGVLSPRFAHLIAHHFLIPKFHLNERTFHVKIDENTILKDTGDDDDDDDDFTPIADGYIQTRGILQAFGHVFERIQLEIHPNGHKFAKEMSRIINERCSNAVLEVTLFGVNQKNDASQFTLETASIVNLRHISAIGFNETIQLNKTFPRMEQLNVDLGSNMSYLNQYFPHLKGFKLQSSFGIENEYILREFFKLNRQLHSVQTPLFYNPAYLSFINDNLSNLTSLSIRNVNTQNYSDNRLVQDIVRFKNVKQFSLDLFTYNCQWNDGIRERLEAIQFVDLNSFAVTSNLIDSVDFLIELIVRNNALNAVAIAANELTFEQLTRLIEKLSDLRTITIEWQRRDTRDILNRFLLRAVDFKMEYVNIKIIEDYDLRVDDVLEVIPVEHWEHFETTLVKPSNSKVLSFKRSMV